MDTIISKQAWQTIAEQLQAPFAPTEVDFRVQGAPTETGRARIVAYIDARAVQDRLDAVVGMEGWSFTWTPVAVVNGVVKVAKGSLSLLGLPPKEDVGDSGDIEPNKSAVSDALKRCAVMWGIGRYLYERRAVWVQLEKDGKGWRIPEKVLAQERARLAVPAAKAPTARPAAAQPSAPPAAAVETDSRANERQMISIRKLCAGLGREPPTPESLTFEGASQLIRDLSRDYNARHRSA